MAGDCDDGDVPPEDGLDQGAAGRLRGEIGEGPFSSYIAPSAVRAGGAGPLILVTPTAYARDWVRKNALRRMNELWLGPTACRAASIGRCRAEMSSTPSAASPPAAPWSPSAKPLRRCRWPPCRPSPTAPAPCAPPACRSA